ncbi:hypothetical protein [Pontibacter rugosus]|uniref:Bacteriophage Gp15 protein n=1 Tax=Pontibacter rugosus TaxID=1745966 RepID=A0ABW3SJQ6_9BACT
MINIYINGLGYRNPVTEADQIIWFWNQLAKTTYRKVPTRFWNSIKEQYKRRLLDLEAYEVLAFINDKTTSAQEKRRIAAREKAKAKAQIEMRNFDRDWKEQRFKLHLINSINYN